VHPDPGEPQRASGLHLNIVMYIRQGAQAEVCYAGRHPQDGQQLQAIMWLRLACTVLQILQGHDTACSIMRLQVDQ
jgi:hypothetical protein